MSWVIWVTGLPGSGKTTLARGVAESLKTRGIHVTVLDLSGMRAALFPGARGSEAEQEIAHRALAYTAKLLSEAGVPVIVDATAPRRAWREKARAVIPYFAEVQLVCPPEICGDRERAVRWGLDPGSAAGGRVSAAPLPDVVLGYEHSLRPDLVLRTDVHESWTSVEELLVFALRLHRLTAGARASVAHTERRS